MSVHQPQSKPYNIILCWELVYLWPGVVIWNCDVVDLTVDVPSCGRSLNGRLCREVHWCCNCECTSFMGSLSSECANYVENLLMWPSAQTLLGASTFDRNVSMQALWVNIWSECEAYRLCGEQLDAQALLGSLNAWSECQCTRACTCSYAR